MSNSLLDDERLVDLLIQQATAGVTAEEAADIAERLAAHPGADRDEIERGVIALTLAAGPGTEPLPAELRDRLVAQHAAWSGRAAVVDLNAARAATERAATERAATAPGHARPRASMSGWWAAAAAVVLAVAGWYPRLMGIEGTKDAISARAQLIATTPGLVRWDFAPTGDPAARGASGDVVWDPATQRGYLRLRGLSANDVRQSQYQLWIFDRRRDERFPIDGGVFDIRETPSEVVIPIAARVHVDEPVLFAVTIERPGGVVVSKRERIAVVAKPASA